MSGRFTWGSLPPIGAVVLWLELMHVSDCGHKGPAPGKVDSRDPIAFAGEIKSQAVYLLGEAKRRPQRGAEHIGILLEQFEGIDNAPVGEHAATYEQLKTGAEELLQLFQRSAAKPEVTKTIDELMEIANSLPGEIRPMTDAAERQAAAQTK